MTTKPSTEVQTITSNAIFRDPQYISLTFLLFSDFNSFQYSGQAAITSEHSKILCDATVMLSEIHERN